MDRIIKLMEQTMTFNKFAAAALSGAILLGASGAANATLSMLIRSGGVDVFCSDNQACDLDPSIGEILVLGQSVGDWTVSTSATSQSNASIDPSSPDLEFTISDAETSAVTTDSLLVIVSESGFGPVLNGRQFQTSMSAADSSAGEVRVISGSPDLAPANQISVLDLVMTGSGFFETTAGVYNGADTGPNEFTLQLAARITHDGIGSTQLTADVFAVPEPGVLALLGLGLLGAYSASRRRTA